MRLIYIIKKNAYIHLRQVYADDADTDPSVKKKNKKKKHIVVRFW